MRLKCIFLLLAGLLLCSGALAQGEAEDGEEKKVYPMPDFQATALDGQAVDTRKLHGKVFVVDIWATWCGPCIESAPELDRMYLDLRRKGLEMLGIAVQSGTAEKVRAAAKKMGMSYPVVLWNKDLASKIEGITAVPTYIVVNQDWNVEKLFMGSTPPHRIRRQVEQLLGIEAGEEDDSR
jgi:thiol-disulfide isomerase/thioredoxin